MSARNTNSRYLVDQANLAESIVLGCVVHYWYHGLLPLPQRPVLLTHVLLVAEAALRLYWHALGSTDKLLIHIHHLHVLLHADRHLYVLLLRTTSAHSWIEIVILHMLLRWFEEFVPVSVGFSHTSN